MNRIWHALTSVLSSWRGRKDFPRSGATCVLLLQFASVGFGSISARSDDTNAPTKSGGFVANLVVNGHRLHPNEERWVRFVGKSVVPQLRGPREERIKIAAEATWWGLKEGIYRLPNPIAFSSCSQKQQSGGQKDVRLGPTQICESGRAWQVGLAGVQVPNFTDQKVLDTVKALWPDRSADDVLKETLKLAGLNPSDASGKAILSSEGALRRSWLLRNPVVGFTLVDLNIRRQCLQANNSYCYGTGWEQTKLYAPTREGALKSIADLTKLYDKLAP